MKALVTGGAGFIGSHLVELLLSKDFEVVVIDNLATGRRSQVPNKAHFHPGDVGDMELLKRVLPGCEVVFHLAAVSSVQDSLVRPLEVHNTNLTATLVLLEACVRHKVPRFIFSSSAAIYGDTGGEPAREDMTRCRSWLPSNTAVSITDCTDSRRYACVISTCMVRDSGPIHPTLGLSPSSSMQPVPASRSRFSGMASKRETFAM